ncbi:MAG: peptidoglycan DD-metalloendopeptidase family protein [Bacteroidota bacterium]|nr:peptidoglycan DD-metalloendopeptidase family protein [Bacteroidota bacterium]
MKKLNNISLFLLLLIGINGVFAQSRKELEKQRKKTEEQIALTQKILKETKAKKSQSLKEITTIVRLIEKREELIQNINQEIGFVNNEIETKKSEIDSVNSQLEIQKKNYARAIKQNYKTKKVYNNTLYLFAAKSFNQFFQRVKFNQYLSKAQEKFLYKINHEKEVLELKLKELFVLKGSKEQLAGVKKQEVQKLEGDKTAKNKVVVALTGKESELKANLEKQKKAKENLNAKINAIIAKEIAEAKRRADAERARKAAAAAKKPDDNKPVEKEPKKQEYDVLPEVKLMSDNFIANKGKLPWPVEKGFISDRFGTHAHAKLDQVMIQNNGIDIQTVAGSVARCVHKGTVTAIISIPGMGKAVLVNHGEYYTVYAKLKDIQVTQGQEVDLKQVIGTIAEGDEGTTEIHFEIWYNQDKQNPEHWLVKK